MEEWADLQMERYKLPHDALQSLIAVDPLEAGAEAQVFADTHVVVEGAALGHVTDLAAHLDRIPEDIEAVDGTGHPTRLVGGVSHVVFRVR